VFVTSLFLAVFGLVMFPSAGQAQLSGTYTIGAGGNYTSFSAAISALSTNGVSGHVTFNILPGTYTEQISISPIPGASSTRTITFDGLDASTRTLQYSVTSSYGRVITLNGADYIRFRNLTINSTHSSYGYGILFTAQADYNEITDCVINLPATTTSTYHIGIVASSTTSYSSTGNWGSNNLIQGNTINSGYYGIRFNGYSGSNYVYGAGNKFIDNTIQGYYYYGLYLYYQSHPLAQGNTITARLSSTNPITAYNSSSYGIYMYYGKNGPKIIGNKVMSGLYPLYFYYANSYTQSTANRGLVANNTFVQIGTSTGYGLRIYYPRYTDVVFNSAHIRTSSTGYGLYLYGYSSSYNNRILNNWVTYKGAGTFYAQYNNSTTSFSQVDHNGYYAFNPNATLRFHWGSTSSYYPTLAAMQTAVSGQHQNSVWGDPYWVTEWDLHSRSHVGYQAGLSFPGVMDDIDGDLRGFAPSIGADEYPAPPPEKDLAISEVMFGFADGKWVRQEDPSEHPIRVVVENSGLGMDPATVTVTYKLDSPPVDENDGVMEIFSPVWTEHRATVEFAQRLSGLMAGSTPTVYALVTWAQDEEPSNDVGMASAEVFSQKVHGFSGFESMETGEYPYTIEPGYLDLPWSRIDNNGGRSLDVTDAAGVGGSKALAMDAPTEAADEWIITPGAQLLGGSSYRFGFDFQNNGDPVTIEAAYGTTDDPTQMTVFATFANIGAGGWMSAVDLGGGMDPYFNTPLQDDTYFVALRFTTSGSNASFAVDNVMLDDNPSPPPKIAFGLPGEDLENFIDAPTTKITLLANYKQPGVINRTYEVQSKTNIYGALGDFLWDVESATPWITLTKETPNPTQQSYNLTPPRPRQFQTFTMTVNPAGLAPGTHLGDITFYGILFNNDFPPPANGLVATNEPLVVPVELVISQAGSKTSGSISNTISTPMTVPGSPYHFTDVNTGEPIATVEVTSGQIDAMTITAYPNQLPMNLQRMLFVRRYWQIKHSSAAWWTANITFPYADGEAGMITDKLQLRGVRQPVMLGAWENPIMGTSSVSDPMTNAVTVHDFNPTNIGGNIALSQPYMIYSKDAAATPMAFGLEQNYPNPFNPTTSIVFTVGEERAVRVAVYDLLGAEMAELVNETLPAGRYEVTFDASDLPSGTYVYRMQAGDFVSTQRMTLSK
jgi:parallel beta-helix repeat protein